MSVCMRPPHHIAIVVVLALAMLGTTAGQAQPLRSAARSPQIYDYRVLERLPAERGNFTQGLQIVDDILYVGTGQYGESRLLEYRFPSMELLREVALDKAFFGEGLTRLGDRLYQLTWRAGRLFVYDANTLELLDSRRISTEGWGITHDEQSLIYSDGSHRLYVLDPETFEQQRIIEVSLGDRPLPRLNELEWIEGEIWANVFMANQLVRIDPASGRVTGIVDLRGLLPAGDRRSNTDVLNGIAWDAQHRALWVTGKRWPWLLRIELIKRSSPAAPAPPR